MGMENVTRRLAGVAVLLGMSACAAAEAQVGAGPRAADTTTAATTAAIPPAKRAARVDNSALIPKVLPDSEVKMEGMSPDWAKTLIMVQFRIETVSPEGTFAAATKVLDHYAEMGVNGLWINPIWERGSKGNGYGNRGPRTIEPLLTGADNIEDSYKAVRQFVAEAHKRNIRVIFDIIVWGTLKTAPLVTEHPEFYKKTKDGQFVPAWGGWAFDWKNLELRTWFKRAAVEFIRKTGADGFRVDLAPDCSGYFFKEVRDALYAEGRKIIIMSEAPNERKDTFDFEQSGAHGWTEEPKWGKKEELKEQMARFGPHSDYLFRNNILDVIRTGVGIGKPTLQQQGKGGMFRFYTSNVLCHDDFNPFVKGNRVRFAYGFIFAPYIPMWWIGEEWDNPRVPMREPGNTGVMYFNTIDWSWRDNQGRAFFEDAKRYIRIRRSYPEIFEHFPDNARDANIVKLDTTRNGAPNSLQAYARYGGGKAVLIVPNYNSGGEARFEVTPDYKVIGLGDSKNYRITDLMTGLRVVEKAEPGKSFAVSVADEHPGVYLVESN